MFCEELSGFKLSRGENYAIKQRRMPQFIHSISLQLHFTINVILLLQLHYAFTKGLRTVVSSRLFW